MNYADVSSAALRYNLAAGNPELKDLNPIMAEEISVSLGPHQLDIELGILGASHYCMVRGPNNGTLTEVFACTEIQADDRRIYCGPLGLGGKIGPVEQECGQLRYSFRAWTQTWSEETARAVDQLNCKVRSAARCNAEVGMEFEFPSLDDSPKNPQRPVTLVALAATQNQVTVTTVHSYPNEQTVVFTETRVVPQERNQT